MVLIVNPDSSEIDGEVQQVLRGTAATLLPPLLLDALWPAGIVGWTRILFWTMILEESSEGLSGNLA